jgi:hypothetical protein
VVTFLAKHNEQERVLDSAPQLDAVPIRLPDDLGQRLTAELLDRATTFCETLKSPPPILLACSLRELVKRCLAHLTSVHQAPRKIAPRPSGQPCIDTTRVAQPAKPLRPSWWPVLTARQLLGCAEDSIQSCGLKQLGAKAGDRDLDLIRGPPWTATLRLPLRLPEHPLARLPIVATPAQRTTPFILPRVRRRSTSSAAWAARTPWPPSARTGDQTTQRGVAARAEQPPAQDAADSLATRSVTRTIPVSSAPLGGGESGPHV